MIRRLLRLLSWWPTDKAIVAACVLGLLALALMAAGVVFGTPLWVITSMSIAQGVGLLAGLIFGVSIAADAGRTPSRGP
jgi:hypothetical protein